MLVEFEVKCCKKCPYYKYDYKNSIEDRTYCSKTNITLYKLHEDDITKFDYLDNNIDDSCLFKNTPDK